MDALTTVSSTDPLTNEWRLVSRLLRHWHDAAKGRRCRSESQINPALVGENLANCAIIRLNPKLDHSSFVVVGANLLPPRHEPLDGQPITLTGMRILRLASPRVAANGHGIIRQSYPATYRLALPRRFHGGAEKIR